MKISALVGALLDVSEKASSIAQAIRDEKKIFAQLVEEKTGDMKNHRFINDFKTLADVLVQETVKHDLEILFPGIADHVYGEESNQFTNTNGDCISVTVLGSVKETSELLVKVLDGNTVASKLLAELVHTESHADKDDKLIKFDGDIEVNDVAIWIDPIDSTAQYIKGHPGTANHRGIYADGLHCVTVLIGVYDRKNGMPLAGVINQPFSVHDSVNDTWQSQVFWGICHEKKYLNNIPESPPAQPVLDSSKPQSIVVSGAEDPDIQERLSKEFELQFAAGAGYKILTVINFNSDAFVLTRASTYKWDTCGPHAILRSMGGGIADCEKILSHKAENGERLKSDDFSVLYELSKKGGPTSKSANNKGGLIAYRDLPTLKKIINLLDQEA